MFLASNADCLSELPSFVKQNIITIHSLSKMTRNEAFKKEVDCNLQDQRVKQTPKFKLGQLVRTADIKRVFSKGDSTN